MLLLSLRGAGLASAPFRRAATAARACWRLRARAIAALSSGRGTTRDTPAHVSAWGKQRHPSFPSNITRKFPPSLQILQGNTLFPFSYHKGVWGGAQAAAAGKAGAKGR